MGNKSTAGLIISAVVLGSAACLDTQDPNGNNGTQIDSVSFLSVQVGGLHACGIVVGNYAYCWGDNTAGQLGSGDLLNHAVPVFVDGGELEFRQISAGGGGACAVTADGDAYCWGLNQFGQLGNGSSSPPFNVPTKVIGGLQFTQVTGGGVHNCGLVGSGQAYCWGQAGDGQLGNGQSGSETRIAQPDPVLGGHNFKELSAGTYHTCGVTTSGEAYCWGRGEGGALGDGSTGSSSTPVAVSGGLLFQFINVGQDHTCAIDLEGNAYCWGNGANGQLGTGARTSSDVPVAVAGGLSFLQISAGNSFTCGIDSQERAFCWGRNSAGELGDGTTATRTEPTLVSGGFEWETISAGESPVQPSTCGMTLASRAYCWGEGLQGQLGTGNTSSSLVPVEVVGQK
jgi:alpha-tubulin suppressor-like RCC1 family protein